MSKKEEVVLLDEKNQPIGTADKATVHTANTPYHRAFSCYVIDPTGNVLITRRALHKATWPGVWTNSACGHPAFAEKDEAAIKRRLVHELGIQPTQISDIECALPEFSYSATDSSGIREWEFCPVYVVKVHNSSLLPNPEEVDSWDWVSPRDLLKAVTAVPAAFSPWMCEQLAHSELRESLGLAS
ncbi:MAG: isopentenyl-diphosphate Delta-isomerase [Corynebacterium sp.]|nr:isopentenyl-diphosphate Delta-isomerase [Corynebacterium sp.]